MTGSSPVCQLGHAAAIADGRCRVALISLASGPRVLTDIVACAPEDVHCGQPVRAVFVPTGDGRTALVRFTPDTP